MKPKSQPLRIVLYGTESTGKTSLARCLAQKFREPWSAEYVRQFWTENKGKISSHDLATIARGQMANEDDATSQAKRIVFLDTDLLTCTLWNDILFPGHCPEWLRQEAQKRAKITHLYLFLQPDVEFVPDPQRVFSDQTERERVSTEIWYNALAKRKLPHVKIFGNWKKRKQLAISAVNELL